MVCNVNFVDVERKLATLTINLCVIALATSMNTELLACASSLSATCVLADWIIFNLSEYDLSSEQEAVCQRWPAAELDLVVQSPNGSCLFAAGSPTGTVVSQNFQTFSTRQTPHLGD